MGSARSGTPPDGDAAPSATLPDSRFLDIVTLLPAIVWEADGDTYRMTYVSERCRDLLGYPPEQWLAEPGFWESHLHPDDREGAIRDADAAVSGLLATRLEYRFRAADGSYRWFHDAVQVVHDPVRGRRLVGVMLDITDRKELEDRLSFQASHDGLTGLRNRNNVLAAAERLLAGTGGEGMALLFLDLDGFKALNDHLGHQAGDEVLRVVARRLAAAVRGADLVGRLGGDEFVVVGSNHTRASARRLALRIGRRIAEPIELGGEMVTIMASAGVAIARPGETVDEVLNGADQAMYVAKIRRRANVVSRAPSRPEHGSG